jgi:PAS domain S-box-containing protein
MRWRSDTITLYNPAMPASITEEKKTIIQNMLKAIVLVGIALTIVAAFRDIDAGLDISNTILNSVILLALVTVLLLSRKIDYELKSWIMLAIMLFMGVKVILVNGVIAGTFYFFLVASIIALLVLERRMALTAIALISLTYLVSISLMAFGVFEPVLDPASVNIKMKLIMEISSYAFVVFVMIGGVGRMQRTFIQTIEELNETNQKLNQSNEELLNQLEQIKMMQRRVEQTEVNFKKLFEESNDGIILCDKDGVIIESNNSIASMLEYPKSFLIGSKASDFVIPDDKRAIDQLSLDKMTKAHIRELHVHTRNGVRIPVEINYSPFNLADQRALLVTVRDIRERKLSEQKVLNAVIQAEENERSRFAKDLHDDLGPILSSIKMYIQSLRAPEDSEDKKEIINRVIHTVDDSVKSIRRISYNLSSHLLQNMGLINALQTHADRVNLSDVIKIEFSHNFQPEQRLPSNIEIVVYRVILELITNSIRHSQGTKVLIRLTLNTDQLVISYSDNGIGFDIDRMLHDNTKGIGLRNIISRVKSIKGLINFETQKSGFSLSIDISL